MHTLGELNACYEILNLIHARIVELEMIVKEDEKQSEKMTDIYEIRVAIQNFLEKELDYDVTDAGSLLDGSEADLAFNTDTGRYSLLLKKEKKAA